MAAAVPTGGRFLGAPTLRGNVLYLALEDHPADVAARLVEHEADPSRTLPRSLVVSHIRSIVLSYTLAQEAVEAVKRMEGQS